jgi:hypothetical protein
MSNPPRPCSTTVRSSTPGKPRAQCAAMCSRIGTGSSWRHALDPPRPTPARVRPVAGNEPVGNRIAFARAPHDTRIVDMFRWAARPIWNS